MPQTATNTRASMANRAINPRMTVAGGRGVQVSVELIFDGVDFKAEDLFDALEAKYGSGKVTSDTDQTGRNHFRLRIKP